jgi:hypothetical protein
MSACDKFRNLLRNAAENVGFMDPEGRRHFFAAEFLAAFDNLHYQKKITGDSCGSIKSVGYAAAEKEFCERAAKLTAHDFGKYEVRILHEDGSLFLLKDSFLGSWRDDEGTMWVFVFCEHYPALLFDAEDLLDFRQLKDATKNAD